MARDDKPILEIPVSTSPRQLQDVEIRLLYDTPFEKEKSNAQGTYTLYIYNVEHDGQQKVMFAYDGLHNKIVEAGARKDTVLSIARWGKGKETKWDVAVMGGPTGPTEAPRGGGVGSKAGSDSRARNGDPAAFQRDAARYWEAFDYATSQLKDRGLTPNVDVNAVAFVFYKMLGDHGLGGFPSETDDDDTDDLGFEDKPSLTSEQQHMKEHLEGIFLETGLDRQYWIEVLNGCRSEGEAPYMIWEDVTLDSGRAAYAYAALVKEGSATWPAIMDDLGIGQPPGLPF